MVDLGSVATAREDYGRSRPVPAGHSRSQEPAIEIRRDDERGASERGIRVKPKYIGRIFVVLALAVIAGEWNFCIERSHAIQAESRTEKEANLKGQAQGGLFNRWTFDQQKSGEAPAGFSMLEFGEGPIAVWTIKAESDAAFERQSRKILIPHLVQIVPGNPLNHGHTHRISKSEQRLI